MIPASPMEPMAITEVRLPSDAALVRMSDSVWFVHLLRGEETSYAYPHGAKRRAAFEPV